MKNPEAPSIDTETREREHAFEELLISFEANRETNGGYIEYNLSYPKEQFLEYLVKEKNFLLHGSGEGLDILEPHQANDAFKKSGNKKAVYAVTDPVFPIFFAIKDSSKIHGTVISSRTEDEDNISYYFKMPKDSLEKKPFKSGVVHILNREDFIEEFDNDQPSNEWTSDHPVEPWAKLKVGPGDFRFLHEIEIQK